MLVCRAVKVCTRWIHLFDLGVFDVWSFGMAPYIFWRTCHVQEQATHGPQIIRTKDPPPNRMPSSSCGSLGSPPPGLRLIPPPPDPQPRPGVISKRLSCCHALQIGRGELLTHKAICSCISSRKLRRAAFEVDEKIATNWRVISKISERTPIG